MKSSIVICGAGIAGIAAAYYLSVKNQNSNIVLVDKLLPMSLTTSKSGENYRDYWPQAVMTEFVSRSLDLMEDICLQTDNHNFTMRQTGYDFVSEQQSDIFASSYTSQDQRKYYQRLTNQKEILKNRPYLSKTVNQVVSVYRAGELDVYALGSAMLQAAKRAGTSVKKACISMMSQTENGEFEITFADESDNIRCEKIVIAAGPFSADLAAMLDIELPLKNYLQRKFVIPDPAQIIPRDMPFTIFADRQNLNWSDEEKTLISTDAQFAHLLETFPAGLHIKPEGKNQIKLGWAFNRTSERARWDPGGDNHFAETVMRGASRFIPGLGQYIDNIPTPLSQYSGYYTRTPENLPLIGQSDLDNVHLVCGLSGFGTMSACAAGELLANILNANTLPSYAQYFDPRRIHNPSLMAEIENFSSDGQL